MRQAIVTKFLGPTNHRGARVRAKADAGSLTVPWDDALDVEENHARAADALADKLNWRSPGNGRTYRLLGGSLPSADGNAYVLVEEPYRRRGKAGAGRARPVIIIETRSVSSWMKPCGKELAKHGAGR